jgi:hypothetical protein
MSYVYTSSPLKARSVQTPEYITREISGETAGRLGDIHIIGIPHIHQTAYEGYLSNLSAFLFATSVQAKVACDTQFYNPKLDPEFLIPLPLPPLVLSSKQALATEDAKSAYAKSISEDVKMIQFIKQTCFLIEKPTFATLRNLPQTINPRTPSPPNATSLFGLNQFLRTVKILSLFLATHSYPAFQTDAGDNIPFARDSLITTTMGAASEGFRLAPSKVLKRVGYTAEEVENPTFTEVDASYSDITIGSVGDAVFVAKPAPLRPSINYGPPSAVPNLPGYVFPYFPGVILPSKEALIATMRRFFIKSFGGSKDDVVSGWSEWLKGVDSWYKTEAGMIVTHIFYLIQTALEAQAQIFVIISDGKYLGAAILGFKFTIVKLGIELEAHKATVVASLAKGLDAHTLALGRVCDILSKMKLDDSEDVEPIDELAITSTRSLYREIMRREVVGDKELERLKVQIDRLTFNEEYWTIAVDKLTKVFRLLSTNDLVPDDAPMYLPSELLYEDGKEFSVLSQFGPVAPSFLDANGKDIPIPKGARAEDPASVRDDASGKRPLEAIFVSGKKLAVAVGDMKNVIKKRRIRQNPNERAAGFRTIKFTGAGRDEIWSSMKMLPYKEDIRGEKRAAEDEEAGPSKKKRTQGDQDMGDENFDVFSF